MNWLPCFLKNWKKIAVPELVEDPDLQKSIHDYAYPKYYKIASDGNPNKHLRHDAFTQVKDSFIETIEEEKREELKTLINRYFEDAEKKAVRNCILDERKRLDGRGLEDIRPIWSEVDYFTGCPRFSYFHPR